jgi:hypothetical protein
MNSLKEDSETSSMFRTRVDIARKLFENKKNTGLIDPIEIDMVSRMINNKIWYNVKYDEVTEEYLKSLINSI